MRRGLRARSGRSAARDVRAAAVVFVLVGVVAAVASTVLAGRDPAFQSSPFFFGSGTQLTAVAEDGAGRVVVTGLRSFGAAGGFVARLRADGGRDTTFGPSGGGGTVLLPFAASGLALDGLGRLLVSGSLAGAPTVVRLGTDGTLDPTFGTAGTATLTSSGGSIGGLEIAIDGAGRILVQGWRSTGARSFVMRLTATGVPDPTFGTGGEVSLDLVMPVDLALGAGGRVYASGTIGDNLTVTALTSAGTIDAGFGTSGSATIDLGAYEYSGGMVDTPSGLAVAGSSTTTNTSSGPAFAARLTSTGVLDAGFGTGGIVTVPGLFEGAVRTLAALPSGQLLLGGYSRTTSASTFGNLLAFLTPTGALDGSFSAQGGLLTAVGTTTMAVAPTAAGGFVSATDTAEVLRWVYSNPDVTPPVPVFGDNYDVRAIATGPSGAIVTFTATARDDVDQGLAATCVPASGSFFPVGVTQITCEATDAAGNTGRRQGTVTVRSAGPVFQGGSAPITREATGPGGATVVFEVLATDGATGSALPVTCAPASGSLFPLGSTPVGCEATTAAGERGTRSFLVTVVDTTPPALTPHGDVVVERTSSAGATATFDVQATDLVDGDVPVSCTPPSGSLFPIFFPGPARTAVTCTSRDSRGNVAQPLQFFVEVRDTVGPTIVETTMTFEANDPRGILTAPSPQFDGAAGLSTCPLQWYPLGLTTVECTAQDDAGTVGRGTLEVRVVDTTPPAFRCCTTQFLARATSAAGAAVVLDPATTDAVDGPGVARCTPPSGSVFPIGGSDIPCTAVDAAGNSAVQFFLVAVSPVGAPDAYTTAAGAPLTVAAPGVLANDWTGGGTASVRTAPAHGTLALLPDGGFTYTPTAGYTGADAFTYVVAFQGLESDPVAVSLTVTGGGTGSGWVACRLPRRSSERPLDLRGADLRRCQLAGLDLRGADLRNANLSGANLSGARLTGARLEGAVLDGVTWNGATCPDGVIARGGGTCIGHLAPASPPPKHDDDRDRGHGRGKARDDDREHGRGRDRGRR